ncbi:class I adenylate-forming enzyme family protein [Streptomyces nitrosporeus]|uniref:class I adenylate-forming enzyme family protein n=1 Tax=Streptomyces nitrosporeus TaxID=28894 RepID=UPI0033316A3E
MTVASYADTLLRDAAARWPEREALVHHGRRWSYGRLRRATLECATVLRSLPVEPGESVAILSGNRPEFIAVQLAVHLIGFRLLLIRPSMPRRDMERHMRGSRPAVLVFEAAHADTARALSGWSRHLLSLGPGTDDEPLFPHHEVGSVHGPVTDAGSDRVRTVLFTGGTTGESRRVVHSHGLYDSLRALVGSEGLATPGERRLVCTPLAHVSGHFVLPTLMSGGTLVLHDAFDPAEVLREIAAERIETLLLYTGFLERLLNDPGLSRADCSTLRRIGYGADPTDPRILRRAMDHFGPVMQQLYGLTEAGVVSLLQPADHDLERPGLLTSAGRPAPGVSVEIRDGSRRAVARGEVGQIWARGPGVMDGYDDLPETEQPLDDGWLLTGDLGYFGAAGHLFVLDREADAIVHGGTGQSVSPAQVTGALLDHPAVVSAAVFGTPLPGGGESVRAVVVPVEGARLDPDDVRAHVLALLGRPHMVPDRVDMVARLPRTALGKVDRVALRRAVADEEGQLSRAVVRDSHTSRPGPS